MRKQLITRPKSSNQLNNYEVCWNFIHFFIQSTKTAFFRDGRASAADLAGTPDAFCTSSAFYFLHGQGIVLLLKI